MNYNTNFNTKFCEIVDTFSDMINFSKRELYKQFTKLLVSIKTDAILGLRNKAIIYIFVTTALRKSELIKIKMKNINSFNGFDVAKIIGKGNKTDIVKLQPKSMLLIKEYLFNTNRNMENNKEDYLLVIALII